MASNPHDEWSPIESLYPTKATIASLEIGRRLAAFSSRLPSDLAPLPLAGETPLRMGLQQNY